MYSIHQQQGTALIALIMILLTVGILSFTFLHRQLDGQVRLYHDERRYYKAYHQASSSLAWGSVLRWQVPDVDWVCQSDARLSLTSCIRLVNDNKRILLKGIGELGTDIPPLVLYKLGVIHGNSYYANNYINIMIDPKGWLDFCPVKTEGFC